METKSLNESPDSIREAQNYEILSLREYYCNMDATNTPQEAKMCHLTEGQ